MTEEEIQKLPTGSSSSAAGALLRALFGEDLRTHSRTGKKGRNGIAKPQLDLKKQAAFFCKKIYWNLAFAQYENFTTINLSKIFLGYMNEIFNMAEDDVWKTLENCCKNSGKWLDMD